jgi:hypothetical protein
LLVEVTVETADGESSSPDITSATLVASIPRARNRARRDGDDFRARRGRFFSGWEHGPALFIKLGSQPAMR